MVAMIAEELLQARIIEKAWSDAEFKRKLLADPRNAIHETFGVEFPDDIQLITLEETKSKFFLVIPPTPADFVNGSKAARQVAPW